MPNNYQPSGFALDIFKKRYAFHENESFEEACDRVAQHVSMAEHGEDVLKHRQSFSQILKQNLFMPGGRIFYGSGRPRGQLLNCFVGPTDDSREGWGKTVSDMIVITGTGGGEGINFSPIRPRGTNINGSGGKATGSASLMKIIDASGSEIKAGGGRRTALMFGLSLTHGDILEFLDKKLNLNELNNANVSVIFDDDPEDFFDKVKKDEDLELKFRGKVIGKISSKQIWNKIITNALKSGEPGLLNGYFANKMSNVWYAHPLICTNPCGEIWLPAYGCCCLGALVLPRFFDVVPEHRDNSGERFIDWNLLRSTIKTSVRFLDNVLTVNNYPLPEIREMCMSERRIGLGITGLHDMLLMMGHKYNTPQALELVDKVMAFIKNEAYLASVDLSKEKGSFPKFDADKFMKSGFTKTLKPTIRTAIWEHGIRNGALLTIAPVGTGSIVCDVTSGIEPAFGPAWRRKFRDGDELKEEIVVHPLFRKFLEEGHVVDNFQSAYDLDMRDHFEMQVTCQKHIDNAVSKTINVPVGTSPEKLSELYMEFFPVLKGVTIYPEGSRENQPITPMSFEEAMVHIGESVANEGALSGDACHGGVCEI